MSLAVEAAGLLLIASASWLMAALLGTVITGLGCSMVFPSLGVKAVRRVPAESRGVALGIFLACFDLGLGAAGPAAGLVANGFGLPAAFVTASAAALVSPGGLALTAAPTVADVKRGRSWPARLGSATVPDAAWDRHAPKASRHCPST